MTPDTLLYRQIHPSWVREGRITSQAFHPTSKDDSRLSVYDGDQITPEDAWNHYVSVLNYASTGVGAVSVEDCEQQQLAAVPGPRSGFPEHALIDFAELTRNQVRRAARRLARYANDRGWMFLTTN